MKIIIAGDGKVGSTLTRQLSAEGCDVTLIDIDPKVLESSEERYDVIAIQGNAASMDVLEQAGVMEADLLIAATDEDEVNMLCCLTAHSMNGKIDTVARIRNPEYAGQIDRMRQSFGLTLTVNPELSAAEEIARLVRFPGFLKVETFSRAHVDLVELKIGKDSPLRDIVLSDLQGIVKCRVLVCAVLRDGKAIAPDGRFVIRENDRIFVTATTENLSTLMKNLGIITRRAKRAMLLGGGRVSYYLAKLLLDEGLSVEIIEQNPVRCAELASLLPDAIIVQGDAGNPAFLDSEGVEETDTLVTLTGMDELNIILSLYGRRKNVPQVITKLGRFNDAGMLNELPLGSVVSPKDLCSARIVRYVRAKQVQTGEALMIHMIADNQAEALEFSVDEHTMHCGEPLRNIKLKPNVLIASITHHRSTEIANGSSSYEQGDAVVVIASGDTIIYSLNDIFAQ